jgi:hypothetical protein
MTLVVATREMLESLQRHREFHLFGKVADDEEGTVWPWERAITQSLENCVTAFSRELGRR